MTTNNRSTPRKQTHFFRDSIALILLTFCSTLLTLYQYNGDSILSDVQNWTTPSGLYLAGTILVNLGSAAIVLYDLISGKPNAIVNTACSCLMIVGAACYAVAFSMDIENLSGYEEAYYIGCVIFVSLKSFLLAALILSNDDSPKAKVELKSVVSVLSGVCMMGYWYFDFHGKGQRPTETQYMIIMIGWALVTLFSAGITYCEVKGLLAKNRVMAIAFGSCLSVGGALVFGGSIAYTVNGDNLKISSEWAISLSVFISCVTTAVALANTSRKSRKASFAYDMMDDKSVNV